METRTGRLSEQDREQLLRTSRRLLAETQALSSRIAAVNEIAVAVNRSLDLESILAVVGRQAKWLLDFEHCSVSYQSDSKQWQTRVLTDANIEVTDSGKIEVGVVARAIQTGQPQLVRDDDPTQSCLLQGYRSKIVLPLDSEGKIIGTINFASHTPHLYTQEDMRIGYLLALQVAAAIRNARHFREVNKLNAELALEKQKSELLLRNILPPTIAEELKDTGQVQPVYYDCVTVMFTDFSNFTATAAQMTPHELVEELDHCFSAFDEIVLQYNLEKLKTSGDAYMCAGGIPIVRDSHAIDAVLAATAMRDFIEERRRTWQILGRPYWSMRIGLHTGPLVAGVIGSKKFVYDVWGDAVNVASRMESNCQPGQINVSYATARRIYAFFDCIHRGKIDAKGKGKLDMYFVKGMRRTPVRQENIAGMLTK